MSRGLRAGARAGAPWALAAFDGVFSGVTQAARAHLAPEDDEVSRNFIGLGAEHDSVTATQVAVHASFSNRDVERLLER